MTLKTVEQWYFECAPTVRFQSGNMVQYWMDYCFWCGELPSDRDFFVTGRVGERLGLVARGYGAKFEYGNGSIFIDPKFVPAFDEQQDNNGK